MTVPKGNHEPMMSIGIDQIDGGDAGNPLIGGGSSIDDDW